MIRFLKSLLPEPVKDRYRAKWIALQRAINPPKLPANSDGKVYVHLGCGRINHPKFINVDAIPLRHIHYVGTVERLPMFADNSVDLIYCCHCLEHISHMELPKVLAEWGRALKPGGILRLSVPDFEKILAIYDANQRSIASIQRTLMGGQDYPYNFHKSAFNERYLASLLQAAGFTAVQQWQPGSCELTTFDDWSSKQVKVNGAAYPISLNLQGEKRAAAVREAA